MTVFDLYSGTVRSLRSWRRPPRKWSVWRSVEEAVEAARENAAANGLDNCRFLAGDVLKVLDEIPEKPDLIVLDPPRDGVHPKALPRIIAYGVERMLYISCKPTSLARDLGVLIRVGIGWEGEVGGYVSADGACGDCGKTTKETYLEILEFTHFVDFFSFNRLEENHKEKVLVNKVTVVVALDLGTGNTKNPGL